MRKNATRKRCSCGSSFEAVSPGGVQLTDGEHCVECTMQLRLEQALSRVRSCRDPE